MTFFAAFLLVLVAIVIHRKHGPLHPAFLLAALWAIAFVVFSTLAMSMGLTAASSDVVLLITLGVGSFCVVPLLSQRGHYQTAEVRVRTAVLICWTVAIFFLFVLGYLGFTRGIGRVAGVDFSQLTLSEIRYIQTAEDRSGGGVAGLLYSLAPLSACLFLLSGREISRVWYWGLVPVFFLVVQSPARTSTLTAAAAAVLFLGLARPSNEGRRSYARVVVGLAVAVALAVGYFVLIGSILGKDRVDPVLNPPEWVPMGMVAPITYLTGGVSAMSFALENGLSGTQWGRSIYTLLRIFEATGAPVKAPETIAEFVPIPIPFNVFTAFGDLWLDFGAVVTLLTCLLLGFGAHSLYRRARQGSLTFVWLTALAGTWALSSFMSFTVMYLGSVLLIALGALVLSTVQVAAHTRPTPSDSDPPVNPLASRSLADHNARVRRKVGRL